MTLSNQKEIYNPNNQSVPEHDLDPYSPTSTPKLSRSATLVTPEYETHGSTSTPRDGRATAATYRRDTNQRPGSFSSASDDDDDEGPIVNNNHGNEGVDTGDGDGESGSNSGTSNNGDDKLKLLFEFKRVQMEQIARIQETQERQFRLLQQMLQLSSPSPSSDTSPTTPTCSDCTRKKLDKAGGSSQKKAIPARLASTSREPLEFVQPSPKSPRATGVDYNPSTIDPDSPLTNTLFQRTVRELRKLSPMLFTSPSTNTPVYIPHLHGLDLSCFQVVDTWDGPAITHPPNSSGPLSPSTPLLNRLASDIPLGADSTKGTFLRSLTTWNLNTNPPAIALLLTLYNTHRLHFLLQNHVLLDRHRTGPPNTAGTHTHTHTQKPIQFITRFKEFHLTGFRVRHHLNSSTTSIGTGGGGGGTKFVKDDRWPSGRFLGSPSWRIQEWGFSCAVYSRERAATGGLGGFGVYVDRATIFTFLPSEEGGRRYAIQGGVGKNNVEGIDVRSEFLRRLHHALEILVEEWSGVLDALDAITDVASRFPGGEVLYEHGQEREHGGGQGVGGNGLLFDDDDFTLSRLYFAALQGMRILGQRVQGTLETWEVFESWLRKTGQGGSGSGAEVDSKLMLCREHVQSLMKILHRLQVKSEETKGYRDGLLAASSLMEGRMASRQSENIRLLTLMSISFLPLMFVVGLFSMQSPLNIARFFVVMGGVVVTTLVLVANMRLLNGWVQGGVYDVVTGWVRSRMIRVGDEVWRERGRCLEVKSGKGAAARKGAGVGDPSDWLYVGFLVEWGFGWMIRPLKRGVARKRHDTQSSDSENGVDKAYTEECGTNY